MYYINGPKYLSVVKTAKIHLDNGLPLYIRITLTLSR